MSVNGFNAESCLIRIVWSLLPDSIVKFIILTSVRCKKNFKCYIISILLYWGKMEYCLPASPLRSRFGGARSTNRDEKS